MSSLQCLFPPWMLPTFTELFKLKSWDSFFLWESIPYLPMIPTVSLIKAYPQPITIHWLHSHGHPFLARVSTVISQLASCPLSCSLQHILQEIVRHSLSMRFNYLSTLCLRPTMSVLSIIRKNSKLPIMAMHWWCRDEHRFQTSNYSLSVLTLDHFLKPTFLLSFVLSQWSWHHDQDCFQHKALKMLFLLPAMYEPPGAQDNLFMNIHVSKSTFSNSQPPLN